MPKWPFQVRGGGQRGPFQFLQDSQDSAFDPASLFASGEQGALLIPGPATTFQISDGTTAAGNGDPVGYIADASGNGNHAVQSVGAARPTLRQSGALWYAETDGVDDWLSAGGLGFTIDDAWTSIWASSIGSNGKFYWSYILATAGAPRLIGDSADVGWYDGISYSSLVPASEGNHVFTLNATSGASANLTGRIDGVTESTITRSNNNKEASLAIATGKDGTFKTGQDMDFYGGLWINRALTADELAATEAYFAALSGVTL